MSNKKFAVNQLVYLVLAVGSIPAGTQGTVAEVKKEGCEGDYLVRCCGVDLIMYEGDLSDVASGNIETSGVVGSASEQSSVASAANGKSHEAGIVDGGATAVAEPYSVAQAISDLEVLMFGNPCVKGLSIRVVVAKLKTIAA